MNGNFINLQQIIENDDFDIDSLINFTEKEKQYLRKQRRKFKAKMYQREKRQVYLDEVEILKKEKARLELELETMKKERDNLWVIEVELLKSL